MRVVSLMVLVMVTIFACKQGPSDENLQKELAGAFSSSFPGVTAIVKEGVVTLTGNCADESCKTASETTARNIKGVKNVVNNISVNPPPPPPPPIEVTAHDPLQSSLNSLLASYKTVDASVENGVVTLTGHIKRSQLAILIQSVHELKPKKVVNKLEIK
jgi:hyperosmotically inducible protein